MNIECPVCLHVLSSDTLLDEQFDHGRDPIAGDYTICGNCGTTLVFEEKMNVRQAYEEDFEGMSVHQKLFNEMLSTAIKSPAYQAVKHQYLRKDQ